MRKPLPLPADHIAWPDYSLPSRYDDDPEDRRHVTFQPCVNNEIALRVTGREPLFFDAIDLLRIVSAAVLDGVYGYSEQRGDPT